MTETRLSIDEKVRLVLQTFNPQSSVAELCRQHNITPRTIYNWKERFVAGGRNSLEGGGSATQTRLHKQEVATLKRIIGEYAVANDALKKTLEGTRE